MTRSRWREGRPSTSSPTGWSPPSRRLVKRSPETRGSRSPEEPHALSRPLAAGIVDELDLQVSPVILGAGERLFDNFELGSAPELELARVLEAPGVAHLRFRVT